MKVIWIILVVLLCVVCTGCVTQDHITNPQDIVGVTVLQVDHVVNSGVMYIDMAGYSIVYW